MRRVSANCSKYNDRQDFAVSGPATWELEEQHPRQTADFISVYQDIRKKTQKSSVRLLCLWGLCLVGAVSSTHSFIRSFSYARWSA